MNKTPKSCIRLFSILAQLFINYLHTCPRNNQESFNARGLSYKFVLPFRNALHYLTYTLNYHNIWTIRWSQLPINLNRYCFLAIKNRIIARASKSDYVSMYSLAIFTTQTLLFPIIFMTESISLCSGIWKLVLIQRDRSRWKMSILSRFTRMKTLLFERP